MSVFMVQQQQQAQGHVGKPMLQGNLFQASVAASPSSPATLSSFSCLYPGGIFFFFCTQVTVGEQQLLWR